MAMQKNCGGTKKIFFSFLLCFSRSFTVVPPIHNLIIYNNIKRNGEVIQ